MQEPKPIFRHGVRVAEITQIFRCQNPGTVYPVRNPGRLHHGILFTLEGTEIYHTPRDAMRTPPGSLFYLPKSMVYHIGFEGTASDVICVNFETVEPFDCPEAVLLPKNSRFFQSSFFEMEQLWKQKREEREMECLSLLYRVLAEAQRSVRLEYCPNEKLERIRPGVDYLHQHYTDPDLRIEQLADCCGFHTRYFSRLFHEIYGLSPKAYLTQLRMEQARTLLSSSRYSVSQVAAQVGYGDLYHFSKTFKQENDLSPTAYMENLRR